MDLNDTIRITDIDTTNPLFGGNPIIMYATLTNMNGSNKITTSDKGFQNPEILEGEIVQTNYNRRKQNVTYKGINNIKITATGLISDTVLTDAVNGTINLNGTNYYTLTPRRFMRLVTSGHAFYLQDFNLIDDLSDISDLDNFFPIKGMPVTIDTWSINSNDTDKAKSYNFTLTFMEDKVDE